MQWPQLLSDLRLGLEDYNDPRRGSRSDFQRDYDRLVFSSPFRRLQNKTQVFPLPGSIFVHNRLTHSMEVACV
ncbi:MAG: dehydrogenase, partial [Muribaculaceae bacterium]|nr:dehydrogenase [Muribaculaceae bacterium]